MKKLVSIILCSVLIAGFALPSFAADENAADKTPVFDNVRTELSIAYAGSDSVDDKYVLAFASTPCGDPVGYELYYEGKIVKTFTDEPAYVTLESPSGEYEIVAYNLNAPEYRASSGKITVETEQVTALVKLRRLLSTIYLDTVIPGAIIFNALSKIPQLIAEWIKGIFD